MTICSNAEQLSNALNEIQPTKIAVAYVGAGWEKYISLKHLNEIILSPTLGSNPFAIEAIMKKKGAENVHFLDNLHSKLYLGKQSALLGSPNLSDNSFADLGRFEVGVVMTEPNDLEQLDEIFEYYKKLAINLYATPESKQEKLKLLKKQLETANSNNINTACNALPSIVDYQPSKYKIHIVWYIPGDMDLNKEAIAAVVPAIRLGENSDDPKVYFSDWCAFREEDLITKGDWILMWQKRKSDTDSSPLMRGNNIYWMHVHHVVPDGVIDQYYPKLACQARGMIFPRPPFDLDDRTIQLIREALTSDNFPALLSTQAEDIYHWRLAPADEVVPEFLNYIKEQYLIQAA